MLLSIIRQNQKLAAKRNPAFDRNRFAKFLIYFMVAFWAAYLIFIGVMLSFAFEDIFPSMEPYHIMNQGLIYLLILDFLLRFRTPEDIIAGGYKDPSSFVQIIAVKLCL